MNVLDDIKKMKQLDPDDMYNKIIHLPEQILKSYFESQIHSPLNFSKLKLKNIDKVIICGMGGSAISGDIAKAAFGNKLPFEVVKDYKIPFLNKNTLVIILSYSGNTEETVSCLKQAISETKFIGAITSEGKVKEIVDENYCWLELLPGLPPRSAIGYLFFSLMKLLEIFEIIPNHSKRVKSVVTNLMKKAGAIAYDVPIEKNLAKSSAEKIKGKIPIIYSSNPQFTPLAYRWKCQINENAKYPAFHHTFPEMNHNEVEGWEVEGFESYFIPIILKRFKEEPQYQKRIDAFKKLLRNRNVEYLEFFVEGDFLVEEIFSLIYLGDMISVYLAILQRVDPSKIKFINFLKKEIS